MPYIIHSLACACAFRLRRQVFNLAARLAEEGFVTFAPHNLYRGEDRYPWLCRKANGIKATLFSFILSQHEQILRWLATLPIIPAVLDSTV